MSTLADVLKPVGSPERISRPADEKFVTVRMRSGGAVERRIGAGKTPVPFTGYRVRSGQFVYSRIDARNGAFAFIPSSLDGAVVSKDFPVFEIREGAVDRGYLSHFFRAGVLEQEIRARSFGATNRQRLDERTFLAFPIQLPLLEEQKRIAAILDQADELRAKQRSVVDHLDLLAQSIFHHLFGELSTAKVSGEVMKVGDLARATQYGTAAKASERGSTPILRMGNITDRGRVDTHDLKYIDLAPSELGKYTASSGDLLFNRTNSLEKVGKAAVIRDDDTWAYAGYLIRVRFDTPAWAEYVAGYLRSADGVRLRRSVAKTAVNQANINAQEMQHMPIPATTDARVEKYATLLRAIEGSRQRDLAKVSAADELFTSLQARAFRGEL